MWTNNRGISFRLLLPFILSHLLIGYGDPWILIPIYYEYIADSYSIVMCNVYYIWVKCIDFEFYSFALVWEMKRGFGELISRLFNTRIDNECLNWISRIRKIKNNISDNIKCLSEICQLIFNVWTHDKCKISRKNEWKKATTIAMERNVFGFEIIRVYSISTLLPMGIIGFNRLS